ncbi:alpha/beta fold hydrolase [Paractinoplanes atraurantiacus]|uniref:Pimeloyl-ACP methyl ester carboxylesterase n=1 Tax=Paractinoplanes atraurantiacus TaxID=1036182 RepID=A0A285K5T5_9ACTN|nr:alpha/beta hydrolase [Actinoplanes atraurantiacus]SNY66681.1 Pimeloyl-ACP methyl ester carboxylesterase [Actinoplanes atraurantiacus]
MLTLPSGVSLSYLTRGSAGGPVTVLLHGLAGSAREMLPTATALAAAGHRAVALDQRGHGRSTRRPGDLSREAFVADVVALIREVADGPVTLVGQSMGGHTAMLTAAWHPDLVGRLVMLEAGVGGGERAELGRYFASWPLPFPTLEAAASFLGPKPITGAWLADLEERDGGWWPRFDADVMQAAIDPVTAVARWAEWEQIIAPTLLVTGEKGIVPATETEQMLAVRPETAHAVIAGAGHDAHLEQPEAWIEALLRGL